MSPTFRSAILATALLVAPAMTQAALTVGARAPDFTTRGAHAGKVTTITLSAELKKGPVVLYFFPAAFTPGCSVEARAFAENIDAFRKAGATVIGMSADPIAKLVDFSVKDCANKFTVASAGPKVVSGYDVALSPDAGMPAGTTNRTSYVIAPTGRIAYVHSGRDPMPHVKETLAQVQAMQPAK